VTVQVEPADLSVADLDAAAQQFTDIYQTYAERLCRFIWHRLDVREAHLAEDLTSETFMELWRRYMLAGRADSVEKPYGLLCTMARSQIGQHFNKKKNGEWALDFADPTNTPLLATGHAYALERPDVAGLVRDLDAAMEAMRAASKTWRDAHKDSHGLRSMLEDGYNASRGGLTESTKASLRQQLDAADQHEDQTLHTFRGTCARVGELRAELEAVAGPNWTSSVGHPVNPAISVIKAGAYRNDRSVTHCPDGHLLDLNNTHFEEDGSRVCRACRNARYAARRTPAASTAVRTVHDDVIEKARAMLADPANVSLNLAAIAKRLNTSSTTLSNRIPDLAQLRKQAGAGSAQAEAADRARRLLTDPDGTLTLHEIAARSGIDYKAMKRALPQEVDVCRQRLADVRVDPAVLAKARRLLTDPQSTLTIHEIARDCGLHDGTLRRRLASEVDACQKKLADRKERLIATARQMLADPTARHTIADIARACGTSAPWVKRNLAAELEAYRARQMQLAGAAR